MQAKKFSLFILMKVALQTIRTRKGSVVEPQMIGAAKKDFDTLWNFKSCSPFSMRPLGAMPTFQERFYQVSRIVELVSDDLFEMANGNSTLTFSNLIDLTGRLDLAVEVIRRANGASD